MGNMRVQLSNCFHNYQNVSQEMCLVALLEQKKKGSNVRQLSNRGNKARAGARKRRASATVNDAKTLQLANSLPETRQRSLT
jgi:hypothetical protein